MKGPLFFACDLLNTWIASGVGEAVRPTLAKKRSAQLQHQPPRYPHFRLFGTSQGRCFPARERHSKNSHPSFISAGTIAGGLSPELRSAPAAAAPAAELHIPAECARA